MYKFTGFTQKANDVLNAAIEYAENMGHTYIGSEHLLLGIVREDGGQGAKVLKENGLTDDLLTEKASRRQGRGCHQKQHRIRRADGADSGRFYAQMQKYY